MRQRFQGYQAAGTSSRWDEDRWRWNRTYHLYLWHRDGAILKAEARREPTSTTVETGPVYLGRYTTSDWRDANNEAYERAWDWLRRRKEA